MAYLVPLKVYTLRGQYEPVPVKDEEKWLKERGVNLELKWEFDSSSGMYTYHVQFDDDITALEFKLRWQ